MTLLAPQALAILALSLVALWALRQRTGSPRPVASLFLWEDLGVAASDQVQRRRRVDRRFLLDAAILTALGLALAKPVFFGRAEGRRIALVLDTSASMAAVEETGSRFELARAEALDVLSSLDPRDEVLLVEAKARPRVVSEPTADKDAIARALRGLEPTGTEARLAEAVALALSRGEGPLEVVVFTDGTASAALPDDLDAPFVHTLAVGASSDNLAIRRLATRPNRVSPFDQEIFIELESFSNRTHTVPLRLRDGAGVFFERRLTVAPGESATVSLRRPYETEDVLEATIDVDDALALDNRAFAVVSPPELVRVLLVARNPFLDAALRVHPLVRLHRATPEEYAAGATAACDVTVLDGDLPRPRNGSFLVLSPSRREVSRPAGEIDVIDGAHPVLALVDLGAIDVTRAPLSPVEAPRGAHVLASASGSPVLAASATDEGRALYLSTDLLGTELPRSPSFPILVSNAIGWLAGREREPAPIVAGAPVAFPFALDAPELPGVYRLEQGGRERTLAVEFPVDAESNLAPVAPRRAESALAPGELGGVARRELYPGLLVIAVLLLLAERRLGRRRDPLGWVALGLVLLSLLDLRAPLGTRPEPMVLVLDASESVSKAATEKVLAEAAATAKTELGIGLVVFGREAWIERGIGAPLEGGLDAHVDPAASNLEAGLRLAGSMLAGEDRARILLASDGNETTGSARTLAAVLRGRGVEVDVLPMEQERPPREVSVVRVEAPSRVRIGEPFDVAVVVSGAAGARRTVALRESDGSFELREVELDSERLRVHFTRSRDAAGLNAYFADVAPEGAASPPGGPGEAGAVVWATGRPRVLQVSEAGRVDRWTSALREGGFDVEPTVPSRVPSTVAALASFDAIVFTDVPARAFLDSQMEAVADYVRSTGGGFLMSGAAKSFGPGGYAGTAIEPLLPVNIRRGTGPGPGGTAVVLVIDKSGSMATDARGLPKIDAAKEAAVGVGQLLDSEDLFGAIAFDREPSALLSLRRVGEGDALEASVDAVRASGPTVARDALDRAYAWLREADVFRRQVVLVSDGQLEDADFERVVERAEGDDIVLSTVGIGEDADRGRLEAIARAGGGEAVFVARNASLTVLARETARVSKDWWVDGAASVRLGEPHPIARAMGPGPLARVTRHVATSTRRGATPVLVTESADPILAAWQPGLGRSAAWTTDPLPDGGGALASGSFAPLWVQTVRWTSRRTKGQRAHPRIDVEGGRARLAVDAYRENGTFINGLDARARVRSPLGEIAELRLEQTGPGRYEGSFGLDAPGTYLSSVSLAEPVGQWEESVALGVYAGVSPELRSTGAGRSQLEEIARIGGGRLLSGLAEAAESRAILGDDLATWPGLALVALVLFLAHVGHRTGRWARRPQAPLRVVRSEGIP